MIPLLLAACGPKATLELSLAEVKPGDPVEVSVNCPNPCIAFVPVVAVVHPEVPHGDPEVLRLRRKDHVYLEVPQQTLELQAPSVPGPWEVRLFTNEEELLSRSFLVKAPDERLRATGTLTLENAAVVCGEPLGVKVECPECGPDSWVGIVPFDEQVGAHGDEVRTFVHEVVTDGQKGKVDSPPHPGRYEARLYASDNGAQVDVVDFTCHTFTPVPD